MTIFITEDDMEQLNYLKALLHEYDEDLTVYSASSYEKAMSVISKIPIDIFLLDIQLEDTTGLSVAEKILSEDMYKKSKIIFITAFPEWVYGAINTIHCFGFLAKPFRPEQLYNLLDTAKEIDSRRSLRFKNRDGVYFETELEDIICIQANGKYKSIHMRSGEYTSRSFTLSDLLKKLPKEFVQVHKSYIINLNYLESLDLVNMYVSLKNMPEPIPIGRVYKNSLLDCTGGLV